MTVTMSSGLSGTIQVYASCAGVIIYSASVQSQNTMDDKLYGHPDPKHSAFSILPVFLNAAPSLLSSFRMNNLF